MCHTTYQPPPFLPEHLKHVLLVLKELGKRSLPVRLLIVLAFFTALRQSNLLLRNASDRPVHTLRRADVVLKHDALLVTVRSTKTRSGSGPARVLSLPRLRGSICCPLKTWKAYTVLVPASWLALALPDGSPLTTRVALPVLRLALTGSTYPDCAKFTLHACRRGAALSLAATGSELALIKQLGDWSSSAVHTYVPKSVIKAAEPLTSYFG